MGKEHCISKEFGNCYIPDSIVLCTTPDGTKHRGMAGQIVKEWGALPTSAMAPQGIPEELYNGEIGRDPGAIAASKVLQVASGFSDTSGELFSSLQKSKQMLCIANDIVLEVEHTNGEKTWRVVNKPKMDVTQDDIRENLHMLLAVGSEKDYIEARFRCGAASFVLSGGGVFTVFWKYRSGFAPLQIRKSIRI